MSIELRSWINPQPYPAGQAEYFSADQPVVSADPAHIAAEAREYEASGYDSSIIPQSAQWPDVWATATWALAHTTRLKVIGAHRPGVIQPAAAARQLATVDRVSGGRTGIHIIMGHHDRHADGDGLDQGAVYARAAEYLEIFDRTLSDPEPFDYVGDFYEVRGAWSGVRPVQTPRPVLSLPVGSARSIDLAARHADVFAIRGQTLEEARELVGAVRAAADREGRTLRGWGNFNVIVDETDDLAWERARAIHTAAIELARQRRATRPPWRPDFNEGGRPPRYPDGPEVRDRALWVGLSRLTGTEVTFVGSPSTIAESVLAYHDELGLEIFTLGSHVVDDRGEQARRELLRLLHAAPVLGGRA